MAEEVQTSDLAAYQSKIRKHHQAAADSAIKNALTAGKLLVKAKTELQHGEWPPVLRVDWCQLPNHPPVQMDVARHRADGAVRC